MLMLRVLIVDLTGTRSIDTAAILWRIVEGDENCNDNHYYLHITPVYKYIHTHIRISIPYIAHER